MKRVHLATIGITLALGSGGTAWAQSSPQPWPGFSPMPPSTTQMQSDAVLDATPAPAAPQAVYTPPAIAQPAPQPMELVPAQPTSEAAQYPDSRRAAPEAPPPGVRRDPNPQTGPYIGHGLFDNWGPNDFGA